MSVKKETVIRTVILFISLLNIILNLFGYKTLPIENETVEELVSSLFLIISTVSAWWYNNSFSKEAVEADEYLKELREKS